MQTYLKTRPVWVQLLLFLGLAFGLFTVLSIIGVFVLSKMTGVNVLDVRNIDQWDPTNPQMITFIRGLLLVQFLGLFLLPSLLFSYFSDPQPLQYLGLKQPRKHLYWILGVLLMFVAIPAVEYIGVLNQKINFGAETQQWMKNMEEEAAKQIQFMLAKHTPGELFINLIFISVFAGIGEELFFRGILQRMFIRAFKNPWMGIVLTAALFSGFHFQFFGFFPRLFLGIVLGVIYWYSGSLWTAMLAHFCYDGFIIVWAYLHPSLISNPDQSLMKTDGLAIMGVASLVLTVALVMWMRKESTVSYAEVYRYDKPTDLDKFSF